MNVMDTLRARGYLKQVVFEEDLYELLSKESVPFYVGFDPTADSLHVGHFLALMAMSHMQKAGHRPICLLGGGTGMIGDPSGRTDMRKVLSVEEIEHNCACFKKQMERFLDFTGENAAITVNNADWLLSLNYVEFLRDVGAYFSVNKMLTAECYKNRMEKGLTFLEFNYMLMQSYDFLMLYQKYGCKLQCGGDDQWSNILSGADLIRRKERKDAFAMTFHLLTTSDGKKMGKSQKGAVWLSAEKTSVYDFYQYWRNTEDVSVFKCMKLLTFLDLKEIEAMESALEEAKANGGYEKKINEAKERLALEITAIVHGREEAEKAEKQARSAFGGDESDLPQAEIPQGMLKLIDILTHCNLAPSKSEARRLISGGGVKVGDESVKDVDYSFTEQALKKGVVLHKGKKSHLKIFSK